MLDKKGGNVTGSSFNTHNKALDSGWRHWSRPASPGFPSYFHGGRGAAELGRDSACDARLSSGKQPLPASQATLLMFPEFPEPELCAHMPC